MEDVNSDKLYAIKNGYEYDEIKVNTCRVCSKQTLLFKDGYTKNNILRWVDRRGRWHNHNLCLECNRERVRKAKRAKKSRNQDSAL